MEENLTYQNKDVPLTISKKVLDFIFGIIVGVIGFLFISNVLSFIITQIEKAPLLYLILIIILLLLKKVRNTSYKYLIKAWRRKYFFLGMFLSFILVAVILVNLWNGLSKMG